jgi:hypothetical protein
MDISGNPGMTSTLYNVGNPRQRAAALAAKNKRRSGAPSAGGELLRLAGQRQAGRAEGPALVQALPGRRNLPRKAKVLMDMRPDPFVPPAPMPRTVPPSGWRSSAPSCAIRWSCGASRSYTLPWIKTSSSSGSTLIVNDPGLIKHVLVDNAANYGMSEVRQLVLRPILRDGC